ncbi:MAG: winged helix-turn-helix transcriptional regulator [Solirubrobacteraceae bacterium]
MTDFLDNKRQQISERIAELQPALIEHARLQAALAALDSIPTSTTAAAPTPPRRRPGRPRGSRNTTQPPTSSTARTDTQALRTGRRRGTGKRAVEALAHIEQNPGATIRELAAKMGISPNYLYRVLPGLAKEGKLKKQGQGWHLASTGK